MAKKKIVVIGGGTGTYTVLKGLKKYDVDLTAVVSMADDGGSTGRLRDEYGVLPPGDIRRAIVALSDSSEVMKQLFEHRFSNGSLGGHSFGNLFIAALKEILKDDARAIKEASKLLNIRGEVLPVTLNNVRLCAELEDGQFIIGETNLDVPKHDPHLKIKRVFLTPRAVLNPDVKEALASADLIILGPGDLYGSIIANLIVDGLNKSIAESKAKKLYVCNLMTKNGETIGLGVSDFVSIIESYLGDSVLDYVVYNNSDFDKELLKSYAKENAFPIKIDKDNFNKFRAEFFASDLVCAPILIRHDSDRLAKVLLDILLKRKS